MATAYMTQLPVNCTVGGENLAGCVSALKVVVASTWYGEYRGRSVCCRTSWGVVYCIWRNISNIPRGAVLISRRDTLRVWCGAVHIYVFRIHFVRVMFRCRIFPHRWISPTCENPSELISPTASPSRYKPTMAG